MLTSRTVAREVIESGGPIGRTLSPSTVLALESSPCCCHPSAAHREYALSYLHSSENRLNRDGNTTGLDPDLEL